MTTSSESGHPPARSRRRTARPAGNLDKVRDLLFGGQMRDYDRKFARLEERLVKETADLRDEVRKRLAALEAYMKAEVESLSDRLRAEQEGRSAGDKDLGRELRDTAQQFDQKLSQLDDLVARNQRDLRQQLHAQHQELGDDIRQRVEDVLGRLAHEAQELRSDKTDRKALAALLTEMAMRLNGDIRALAPGDEVACLTPPRRGRTIRRPVRSDTPAAKFTELRALLVGPEQRQLRALQTRLEDPAAQARDVSRVLATAVELRTNDPHLQRALAPTIEDAITASVRRNPRPLADALFPIIGPAIRKAIAATLSGMLESLNTTLEHSLSWRSLQWRLDARRTGKPFAEIVLLNTLVYRVEQVFLIHRPSGLLLQHLTASGDDGAGRRHGVRHAHRDPRLRAGLVQGRRGRGAADAESRRPLGLDRAGPARAAGGRRPRRGAAVAAHHAAAGARERARAVFGSPRVVRRECGPVRRGASAARGLFPAAVPRARAARGIPPRLMVIAATVLLALGVWMFFALRARSRWNGYVDALRAEPGIVVVSTGRAGGKYVVTGPARSAGPRSRLAAAVPQSRTRLPWRAAGSCIRRCTRRS